MSDETTGGRADTSSIETNRILEGDAEETLSSLPESSVHMAMCSPPYYGLRDYGPEEQIGLEDTLDEYISRLINVGEELKRVIRDDGSWWLNLGDSYAGSWGAQSKEGDTADGRPREAYASKNPARSGELKPKSKMLVPHRVAIALESAGWIVRNDVVWAKPNPMPHSVKDRLNTTHEFVFHLVQQGEYHYDLDAIREPHKEDSIKRDDYNYNTAGGSSFSYPGEKRSLEEISVDANQALHPKGKNPGDVFDIPVRAFPDAHFAVYPPELCEKPIKATCPEGGIVLDPFAGAGTTCLVAKRLGRRFVGIDLNPEYVAMAQKRCGLSVDNPALVREDAETGLEAFTDGGQE